MREILFRGKRVDNGEWVEGYLLNYDNCFEGCLIYPKTIDRKSHSVTPSSVGQYTGLTDKNGVKIFEGDKCRFDLKAISEAEPELKNQIGIVESRNLGNLSIGCWDFGYAHNIKIISNIHDNKELLK